MAAFSESAFSRPFSRWDLVAIVKTQGSWGSGMRGIGREEGPKP